jgi:two-component system OmpR family response regulator
MARAVLIVEDDPPLRGLLRTLLQRADRYDIATCADGQEAIELLAGHSFDVILLDLMMPRKDGFAVIDYLRAHRPAQLSVVLVMTAMVTDDSPVRLDPSVVHGVISKPFDNADVVSLVHEIFESSRGAA